MPPASITVIEPLGKENFVDLAAGDLQFMAIIAANTPVEAGEDIELTFNMDKTHLFERKGDGLSVLSPLKRV